jgi:hypothetical protein
MVGSLRMQSLLRENIICGPMNNHERVKVNKEAKSGTD